MNPSSLDDTATVHLVVYPKGADALHCAPAKCYSEEGTTKKQPPHTRFKNACLGVRSTKTAASVRQEHMMVERQPCHIWFGSADDDFGHGGIETAEGGAEARRLDLQSAVAFASLITSSFLLSLA
ncbi:hypothetical protein XA68_18216 [Ophiocordyceps unilateralis]|uniref:Uncharacterized protein n=1 Tax=Ophiocordyceps unilateralis TaxID=268505 RepID=A0A2A9PNY1_OPHUN|nr:hypothetical protein XA68_18216 [Ophiocordyceps unilateralis]